MDTTSARADTVGDSRVTTMQREPSATIRLVAPFVRLGIARRVRRSSIWESSGVDALLGDAQSRVPHSVLNVLLGGATSHVGTPDVGLLAAEEVRPGDFDVIELALQTHPTVREALQRFPRLMPLLHDGAKIGLIEQPDAADIRFGFEAAAPLHPVGYDFVLALLLITLRRSVSPGALDPIAVFFPYSAREDLSVYRRVFGCPLHFDAPEAVLRFDPAVLTLPLVHANPAASAALERAAMELIETPARGAVRSRAVAIIAERLSAGQTSTAKQVAKALGMSMRSFQRRLDEEGTSFRELLTEHRVRMARAFLGRRDLTIAEVAMRTGFASSQAFHKAFKRWTGETPSEARARELLASERGGPSSS